MAMQKNDDQHITREFWQRQGRQILALAAALFLVILLAVVYKRHDLFGEYSKDTLVAAQLVVMSAFIGFTAINWRCVTCKSQHLCVVCRALLLELLPPTNRLPPKIVTNLDFELLICLQHIM
jgi:hypothetical protein